MPTPTVASPRLFLPVSQFLGGRIGPRNTLDQRHGGARASTFVVYAARKDSNKGENGNGKKVPRFGTPFPDGSSEIESPVPWDQLPINEFNSLQESRYFSWAVESVWLYAMKLGAVGVCCTLVGWPVALLSVTELWRCGVGALSAGLMGSTLAALRLYLGWSHVGNRLFSVTVEYEETSWYDGQTWIKPPEVLARDRLVGSYTVKPALNRVKTTLIGLAVSLSACAALLFTVPEASSSALLVEHAAQEEAKVEDVVVAGFRKGYSEESARRYEPEAFSEDYGDIHVNNNTHLEGYCTPGGMSTVPPGGTAPRPLGGDGY